MFEKLGQHQFHANMFKCIFALETFSYLDHVISAQGIQAEPVKLEIIQQWPQSNNFTNLHGFLALTGYYRRVVRKYAAFVVGLTNIVGSKP